jgi:hypothetical protein
MHFHNFFTYVQLFCSVKFDLYLFLCVGRTMVINVWVQSAWSTPSCNWVSWWRCKLWNRLFSLPWKYKPGTLYVFTYKATMRFEVELWLIIWPIKYELYVTKSLPLDSYLKDVSNNMFLVSYNLYFVDQIISQSFASKYLVALYIKNGGSNTYVKKLGICQLRNDYLLHWVSITENMVFNGPVYYKIISVIL